MRFLLTFVFLMVGQLSLAQSDDLALDPLVMPVSENPPGYTMDDEYVIQNPPKEASGFTEYFLLYEVRNLRMDLEAMKRELYQEFANRELSMIDRATSYTVNTMTLFFYIITIVAAILALFGWRTIRDLKTTANERVQGQIDRMVDGFQERMKNIEDDLVKKGEEIVQQQEELQRLQQLNSLWVQVNRERDDASRLNILEEIKVLDPENTDALVMKSNAYVRLEMYEQALEMANQALEIDADRSSAHYAKAKTLAQMGEEFMDESISSLRNAFNLSAAWREYKELEADFVNLKKNKDFKKLLDEWA